MQFTERSGSQWCRGMSEIRSSIASRLHFCMIVPLEFQFVIRHFPTGFPCSLCTGHSRFSLPIEWWVSHDLKAFAMLSAWNTVSDFCKSGPSPGRLTWHHPPFHNCISAPQTVTVRNLGLGLRDSRALSCLLASVACSCARLRPWHRLDTLCECLLYLCLHCCCSACAEHRRGSPHFSLSSWSLALDE